MSMRMPAIERVCFEMIGRGGRSDSKAEAMVAVGGV